MLCVLSNLRNNNLEVKTTLGLLDALKEQYISNLEVSDEGEYAETRDINRLKHKKAFLEGAIRSMADSLREHGLGREAAEDPNIVAKRIERVALLVQQKITNTSAESPPATRPEPADEFDASLEDEVATINVPYLDCHSGFVFSRSSRATVR